MSQSNYTTIPTTIRHRTRTLQTIYYYRLFTITRQTFHVTSKNYTLIRRRRSRRRRRRRRNRLHLILHSVKETDKFLMRRAVPCSVPYSVPPVPIPCSVPCSVPYSVPPVPVPCSVPYSVPYPVPPVVVSG